MEYSLFELRMFRLYIELRAVWSSFTTTKQLVDQTSQQVHVRVD